MATSPPHKWQSLSECLDWALQLPEANRTDWLAALASTQPELAAEAAEVLGQSNRLGYSEFLESPLIHPDPKRGVAALIGRSVGPYVIERELGRGGMGSVWLAQRADDRFDALVAVKFLHMSWLGVQGEQRFRSEGQLLGRLHHPNIARLIDAGLLEGTHPYLVIEYVEGEPIDVYCDREQLGLAARLTLFLEVLAAVAHAHAHLVVHRDIKPSNILVTRNGMVKLLDFGVARLLDSASGAADATRSTATALTPQFAAPEQFLGKAATTATDVYSLGLTLYVLLTGGPPVALGSTSTAEQVRVALDEDAPRASSVSQVPTISRRSLQGDLDNILAKATRKAAVNRYASVEAFADDLRCYLEDEPVKARADTTPYRLSKFVRRHRGGVMIGLLTALALIVATIFTFLQKLEADRQRNMAEIEARRAESTNDFLNLLLLSDAGGQAAITAAGRIEQGARMLELQYRDDPRFAGRMLVQLSTQYRGQTLTSRAVELDQRAYDLGKGVGDTELMALAQCGAAYTAASAGLPEDAAPRVAEAKRLIADLGATSISLRTDCARAEAMLDIQLEHFAEAERILLGARHGLEQDGQSYRAAYTSVLNDLGGIYNATGRPAQALDMARLIGATHEHYGRGETTARVMAMQNEAAVLLMMGEAQEAARVSVEVRRRRALIRHDSSEPLSMSVNYAEILVRLGRNEEGADLARAASERATAAGNSLWHVYALGTLGMAYIDAGDFSRADSTIAEMSSAISQSSVTDAHFLMMPNQLRARLALRSGDSAAALREAQALLATVSERDKSGESWVSLNLAAQASFALGRPTEAERFARRALIVAEAAARGPVTSGDVGETLLLLAKVQIAERHGDAARPLLERAERCLTHGLGVAHPLTREASALVGRTV